jgi:hypothetical protein
MWLIVQYIAWTDLQFTEYSISNRQYSKQYIEYSISNRQYSIQHTVCSIQYVAPRTIFTTVHFLLNLRMGPTSYSVTLHYAKRLSNDKYSSLLGAFVSYEENEVL